MVQQSLSVILLCWTTACFRALKKKWYADCCYLFCYIPLCINTIKSWVTILGTFTDFIKGNYNKPLRTTERCDLRLFCRGEEMTERYRAGFVATLKFKALTVFWFVNGYLLAIPHTFKLEAPANSATCDMMICPSCSLTLLIITTGLASSYWLEGPAS